MYIQIMPSPCTKHQSTYSGILNFCQKLIPLTKSMLERGRMSYIQLCKCVNRLWNHSWVAYPRLSLTDYSPTFKVVCVVCYGIQGYMHFIICCAFFQQYTEFDNLTFFLHYWYPYSEPKGINLNGIIILMYIVRGILLMWCTNVIVCTHAHGMMVCSTSVNYTHFIVTTNLVCSTHWCKCEVICLGVKWGVEPT